MAKSGTDEHQRTVAVRKCTNGPCTAAYLVIYSFRQVIRADSTPGKSRFRQRFPQPSWLRTRASFRGAWLQWTPPFPELLLCSPAHGLL